MSTLYLYDGKLLAVDGKLATNENCCCDTGCPEPTTNGVIDLVNFGWTKPPTKTNNSITAIFKFEDSKGGFGSCGLMNGPNQQTGTAQCSFTLNENKLVTLLVDGNTEDESPGFDYGLITIEGVGVPPTQNDPFRGKPYHVFISSSASGNGCDMFSKNDQLQINLDPGVYTVFFNVDTVDPAWHQNMIHNFSVTW